MGRVLVLVLAAGCSGTDGVTLDDGGPDPTETEDCLGAETFVAGISKTTTSGLLVAIGTATPTPPDVGDNTWTISVTDADGPVDDLKIDLVPWMPLHGHGLTPPTYRAVSSGDGTYAVPTFDLIMPGTWEFRFDAAADEDTPDEALFEFCAEG